MLKLVSPNFSDILEPNLEVGKFPDGDAHVRILNLEQYKNQEVIIYHRLYPKQNTSLVVLLLILDTFKEIGAKASVVSPYLPYARQDKTKLNGEVGSAKAICNLLARAGCQKLYTFDCHFLNAEGEHKFGELTIQNISMAKALAEKAKAYFKEPFEIVVPDAGAAYLVKDLGGKAFKKVRKEYDGEKIAYRDIESLSCDFDIKEKNFLVLDDMISTGNTMVTAIQKLKECGAKQVCSATTHGLFLFNCLDKLQKLTDCIFSTDTIPTPQSLVSIKEKLP
ncbi:MAG: ribose-phosphate pyrophosphokinase [Candidatus Doudnabacteria bacterium]|nr:ribose-phosphate pyrophosphokinase [Candidatus Doudnabacteria bacterium]